MSSRSRGGSVVSDRVSGAAVVGSWTLTRQKLRGGRLIGSVRHQSARNKSSRAALQLQNNTKPLTNLLIIHILTSTCVELCFLEAGRKSRKQLCRSYIAVLGRKRARAAFGVAAATAARKCRSTAATAAYESLPFLSFLVTAWNFCHTARRRAVFGVELSPLIERALHSRLNASDNNSG